MRAGKGDEGATGGSDRAELGSCEELEQSGVWEDPGETESWERRRGGDWRVRPSGAGELRGVGAIGVWEDPRETESWERRRGGDWRVRPSGAGELRGVGAIGSMGGSGRDRELGATWEGWSELDRSGESEINWSYRERGGDGRNRPEAGGSGSQELRERKKNRTTAHTRINLQRERKRRGKEKVLRPHQIGDNQESHRTRENKNPTRLS